MEDHAVGVSSDAPPKKKRSPKPPEHTDERREYDRLAQKKSRGHKAALAEAASRLWDSAEAVTKKNAREILTGRGIENSHVIETLIDLAEQAAISNQLPFNQHLLSRGLRATLAAMDGKELPAAQDGIGEASSVVGELLTRKELYALWDLSMFRSEASFDEFLSLRRVCKTDCFRLGLEVLGKDFHEQPHKHWADFFPAFNPDGLRPNYSQEEMKAWLASQSDTKEFLLLASRNAYKSSFSIVWLVSAILCCPDIRALLVSETKPLSRGFIRSLRNYFEIKNVNEPSKFQQLFPEYAIPVGEGSTLTFECPMAHLGLIQPAAESTSMDSTVAGSRADIILFDDPISNVTTGNEEMRQGGVDKYDLVLKLREVGGYATILGTPWHPADLYAVLIRRNEQDSEKPLAVRIDPAWTVKPGSQHKELKDLAEQDVTLLFPSRLTWKFLQKERKNNERFFRSQNLCEFVPEVGSETLLNFSRDELTNHIISASAIPPDSQCVIVCDIAYSQNKYADLSALSVVRLFNNSEGEKAMAVVEIDAGRMRASEFAQRLVMLTRKHAPGIVALERSLTWDVLAAEVTRVARLRETNVPLFFAPVSNQRFAKFMRLKALEVLLHQGRLKFVASGPWLDDLFNELERLDGGKSSSGKKDDRGDSLALCAQIFIPASTATEDTEAVQKLLETQKSKAIMDANYSRIFGGANEARQAPTPDPPRGSLTSRLLGPAYR
jgi:hypothetical protein